MTTSHIAKNPWKNRPPQPQAPGSALSRAEARAIALELIGKGYLTFAPVRKHVYPSHRKKKINTGYDDMP